MITAEISYCQYPCAKVASLGSLSLAAQKRSPIKLAGRMSREEAISRIRQRRLRILVVDDDAGFRASMVFMLEGIYEATVAEADTGLTALDAVSEGHSFDLILMDVMMPGMDGIEASKAMRARGITARIALMSADYGAERRARARDLSIILFDKPVDLDALELILLECGGEKPDE